MYHAILIIVAIIGCVVYTSHFEYALHRWPMHRPFKKIPRIFRKALDYAYERHTLIHHHVFRADRTYHVQRKEDKKTIPMAWWNILILVPILDIIPALLCVIIGHWLILMSIATGVGIVYYTAYETSHWCMHCPKPKRRLIERVPVFGRLLYEMNGRHVLHHRYMNKNFNVVLPIADLLLGTLILRSRIPFPQVRGPGVPNVQPLA